MIRDHCKRCGKVYRGILNGIDLHTCNPHAERSNCCNVKVWIAGRHGEGSTRWYQCTNCEQPCDLRNPSDNIES